MLNAAAIAFLAPSTLVRIRGLIVAQPTTTASTQNEPSLLTLMIRKISLDETDSTYVPFTGDMFTPTFLSNEDILWTGAIVMLASTGSGASGIGSRNAGFVDVDVKSKRTFESAEERLVLEAVVLNGDGSTVDVSPMLRILMMVG